MSAENVTLTEPYRVASGEGLADVWWKSGRVTVKAGGAQTGHAFSQIETDDPRGSGPPLHLHHNEDETFYVLEGAVTLLVGDDRFDLDAGDYCFGPREVLMPTSSARSGHACSSRPAPEGSKRSSSAWVFPSPAPSPRPMRSCRRWTS